MASGPRNSLRRWAVALWIVTATLIGAGWWSTITAPESAAASVVQSAGDTTQRGDPTQAGARAAAAREALDTPLQQRAISRRSFPTRVVLWGIALQLIFALLILRTAPGEEFFSLMNTVFIKIMSYTQDGSRFIFGNLIYNNIPVGEPVGSPPTMAPIQPGDPAQWANGGSYFAFTVLPTIIFFASLMTVLYHLKVMQIFVKGRATSLPARPRRHS
jgi:hypothetical protein